MYKRFCRGGVFEVGGSVRIFISFIFSGRGDRKSFRKVKRGVGFIVRLFCKYYFIKFYSIFLSWGGR